MSDILDQAIYPERRSVDTTVRKPYTMDNDIRPAIVAILTELIEPADNVASMYPRSKFLAEKISDRAGACNRPGIVKHSKFMAQSIEINVLGWHRQIRMGASAAPGRIVLTKNIQNGVLLFAETIVRATQIYDETLMRNQSVWQTTIGDDAGFNWAFDMSYIELAIADLSHA